MNEHQKLAIYALECHKSDDTARARHAFRGMTSQQMQKQYGASGKTCAEVLADYEASDAKVDKAIQWVKEAK